MSRETASRSGRLLMHLYAALCYVLYHTGVFQAYAVRKHASGACLVLAYHGISQAKAPLCTSMKQFKRHLGYLARWGTPIDAETLGGYLAGRIELKGLHYLISFDDPFENAMRDALPELARRSIRPLVFISSGLVEDTPPWWFALPAVLRKNPQADLTPLSNDLIQNARTEAYPDRLLESAKALVPPEEFPVWLNSRLAENQVDQNDIAQAFPEGRIASWDLLKQQAELFDPGSHTVHHSLIGRCTDHSFAEKEIAEAEAAIQAALGRTSVAFAYPNGGPKDHSEWSRAMLEQLGCEQAFTMQEALVHPKTDPLKIPRLYVAETPCWELASKCCGFHAAWISWIDRLRQKR